MSKINLLDIRKLDLNLVAVFLAIWEERSVTRAASRLALSQAATSSALTRLREVCGDALFVRIKGGMEPTVRAAAMAASLDSGVTQLWQTLTRAPQFAPGSSTRRFTIGMSDDFELALGPQLARRVQREAPQAGIVFRQTNSATVERMLDAGEIELAIVAGALKRAWLSEEVLGRSGYACLLGAARARVAWPLSLDDYVRLPHVLVSFSGREGIVDPALKLLGKQRKVHVALTHFSALPLFLESIEALATLPAHAARALARPGVLFSCPVPVALGTYPVALLARRDGDADHGLSWLKDKVKQAFINLPAP